MKLVRAKEGYRKVGDKYLLAKKCTKCGEWKVANTVNFYKNKASKCGLESYCKECKKGYDKQWQQTNRDRKAEYNKRYREDNKDKMAKYGKQYREANKDKIVERQKQWHEANPEYYKQYYQSPKGQVSAFNARNKRRHKKAAQGTGVTPDQWLEMMQYFDWRCAYSGERLTDKTRSGDHIVPIDAGGDDMIWNMVPMLRNLNSSKQAKDMLEWYEKQDFYSEARLAKIYEWQEYARKKWQNS